MKLYLIIPSINVLSNFNSFKNSIVKLKNDVKIIVIDEGDEVVRAKNDLIFNEFDYRYFGPKERIQWFKNHFAGNYKKYYSVIPIKCHAEISFGFLIAWEEKADVVIELDDDCYHVEGYNLIEDHLSNLFNRKGVVVQSDSKWYNTLENLTLNDNILVFPRGYPYGLETRVVKYGFKDNGEECVLNMGLWAGYPDLDALTTLYNGGLDGRSRIKSFTLKREKIIIGQGTYFPVCSMNTSFRRKIIPAFYQLYMKIIGIDRFDDIWSGLFVKKIADHLEDNLCLGKPLVYHEKRPRSTFRDLKAELEGIIINELLWRIVDSLELNGKDYFECYLELANGIEKNIGKFTEKAYKDFIELQLEKMKLWLEVLDKI
jgi:hypothetical protein